MQPIAKNEGSKQNDKIRECTTDESLCFLSQQNKIKHFSFFSIRFLFNFKHIKNRKKIINFLCVGGENYVVCVNVCVFIRVSTLARFIFHRVQTII